jgi:hypothetical protein
MEATIYSKIRRKLLPFLFVLYVIAYLDRVNVGFAALQMNRALGLSEAVFGFGAGIFFIGYFVLEIPSNLILQRLGGPRLDQPHHDLLGRGRNCDDVYPRRVELLSLALFARRRGSRLLSWSHLLFDALVPIA